MYCHNALGNKSPLLFLCKIKQKLFHSAQYFFFLIVKYVTVLHMCKILIWISINYGDTWCKKKNSHFRKKMCNKAESTLYF